MRDGMKVLIISIILILIISGISSCIQAQIIQQPSLSTGNGKAQGNGDGSSVGGSNGDDDDDDDDDPPGGGGFSGSRFYGDDDDSSSPNIPKNDQGPKSKVLGEQEQTKIFLRDILFNKIEQRLHITVKLEGETMDQLVDRGGLTFTIIITDSYGNPIEGATVGFNKEIYSPDENGEIVVNSIVDSTGYYKISTELTGYIPGIKIITIEKSHARTEFAI
jgi:hypothetical protein